MEKLDRIAKQTSVFLFICYIAGFFEWNYYLSRFGFFEFDLLQTRFLSAGLLTLFLPLLTMVFIKGARLFFEQLNFSTQIFIFLIWLFIFSNFFPLMPQYIGGAVPSLASIVSNEEINESFQLMGLLNTEKNKTIQTVEGCKLYENKDQILIGFASSQSAHLSEDGGTVTALDSQGVRVLALNKDKIQAINLLAQDRLYENTDAKVFDLKCVPILNAYGFSVHPLVIKVKNTQHD